MYLYQFLNGLRVLWNLDADEYLACINHDDRDYFGDGPLWSAFTANPHKTFSGLPDQDKERIFAVIQQRNERANLGGADAAMIADIAKCNRMIVEYEEETDALEAEIKRLRVALDMKDTMILELQARLASQDDR